MRFTKPSANIIPALAALFLLAPHLFAQTSEDAILRSYEKIFIRSNLSAKANVLYDAANDEKAATFYGAFCEIALRFVIGNAALFPDDPDMIQIAVGSVKGIAKCAYTPAAENLWQLFLTFPDNVIRVEILRSLPALKTSAGKDSGGNAFAFTEKLNDFLTEQNSQYKEKTAPNINLLSALFETLGKIGDDSSYLPLFTSCRTYSGALQAQAAKALYSIDGNFTVFLTKIIVDNPPEEKLEALKLIADHEGLSAEKKGILAEAALETALASPGEQKNQNKKITDLSVRLIGETKRISALPLVFKYYNQSMELFRNDPAQKQPLLDAISCLGFLKDSEAAKRLSLQLGIYNSRIIGIRPEEQDVTLAIISALGNLGYKVSRDSIYQASKLPWPQEIKDAAQIALKKLQW
jgi:hypothetical protein